MSDTAYPVFQHYGTNAQRLAFTPSPPATGQPIYVWYENDTNNVYIYTTSWHLVVSSAGNVTAAGTLTNNALVIGQGTTAIATTTTGTGILTALGINVGSAGAPVVFNGALGTPSSGTLSSAILGSVAAYLNYQDQKAQNTAGGTFTSGAWRTRTLNTEVSDVGGYGTLSSNQITLAAGTYIVLASAPAYKVDRHQLRFQNTTDNTTLVVGQNAFTGTADNGANSAQLSGTFTVAASKALELQHQCATTEASNGMGIECNFTTEVYAMVELWKIG